MAVARKKPGLKAKKKAATKKPAASKKKAVAKPKKKVGAAAKTKTKKLTAKPKKKVGAAAKTKTKKLTAKPKKKVGAAAKTKTKKLTAKPKKKVGAAAKTKTKKLTAKPKKKAAAATKTSKLAPAGTRKKTTAARQRIPAPLPSERAIAVAAQLPKERALTDVEREAMTKVAQTALALLEEGMRSSAAEALSIVQKIGAYVDAVRAGAKPEPTTQDERLGIGVLWGEQLRAQVGWRWVHLSYADGFASYALVPDDRAFACFPLNRLAELVRQESNGTNTSVALFDSIRAGTLPQRRENAYLVIG